MTTVTETLYLYDPEFLANAEAFKKETTGSCAIHPIPSYDTLKEALHSYSDVGFMVIDTHGAPGKLSLADGTNVYGLDFTLPDLRPDSLFRKDARVLFYGCNIAEGTEGDTFLDDFGMASFRGKGGIAGGSTVTNFSWSLGGFGSASTWMIIGPFFSGLFSARLKVVRYNEAGLRADSISVNRWGKPD